VVEYQAKQTSCEYLNTGHWYLILNFILVRLMIMLPNPFQRMRMWKTLNQQLSHALKTFKDTCEKRQKLEYNLITQLTARHML